MVQLKSKLLEKVRKTASYYIQRQVDISFYLADGLDKIMKEKHISAKQLSEKTKYSELKITTMLSGMYDFKISEIAKIEESLGCIKLL